MIRVLHLGLSSNPGGVERLILNYHRNIEKKHIQFDYLDLYGDGIAFSKEIKRLGGKVYSISNYKRHPLKAAKQLNNLLKNNYFDIIHVHMQSAANIMPLIIVSKRKKEKVIAHCHSSSTPKGFLRKIMNMINSNWIRKQNIYKWACGVKAGNWMWGSNFDMKNIIPNAIDYDIYKFDRGAREKLKREIGFEYTNKVIGFVGRFGDEKNTFFLIEVLKELIKISADYRLLTVGGNDLYNQFIKKVNEERLDSFFYSAGIQKQTSIWYQIMDAFLLPSFFEGFPMVGVEAQVSGLPCFFSNRISDEIRLSKNTEFLPIEDGSAALWARKIDEKIKHFVREEIDIPDKYKIKEAAGILEKRYIEIITGEYNAEN